jgi:hypothetical protein
VHESWVHWVISMVHSLTATNLTPDSCSLPKYAPSSPGTRQTWKGPWVPHRSKRSQDEPDWPTLLSLSPILIPSLVHVQSPLLYPGTRQT